MSSSNPSVAGMYVAITGAGSGIGAEVARQFVRGGATVYMLDRDRDRVQEVVQSLGGPGETVTAVALDVGDRQQVCDVLGRIDFLDVLVNSAGICLPGGTVNQEELDWERTLTVNLTGTWLCAKHAIPAMRRRGGGTIVNIGSNASLIGIPDAVAYVASKGGVAQLTKAMALDLAVDRIRVNCVCPGHINTPMGESFIQSHQNPEQFRGVWAAAHPLGRLGDPSDVAGLVVFLASPAAEFITGAIIPVDGGYTAR